MVLTKLKKKNFSLIHAYRDTIIPQIEEITRKESKGGIYDVRFIQQEDGAGCYTSEEYMNFKNRELKKRNWLRRMQSPQSPLFNVNDIYIYFEN